MVFLHTPVNSLIAVIPPLPSDSASAARYLLFCFSFNLGNTVSIRFFDALSNMTGLYRFSSLFAMIIFLKFLSGRKLYETRGWATSYTGPITIHAAKWPVRRTIDALASAGRWDTLEWFEHLFQKPGELGELPIGAIVGKAVLTRCNLIDEAFLAKLTPQERALGDFTLGRYAWEFSEMTACTQLVAARGAQGLWDWNGVE